MTTPTDPKSLITQARKVCEAATPGPLQVLVCELAKALEEMTVEWERIEESATSYRESMVLARQSATAYRDSMLRAQQELADHKAKMVGLLADAYAKGRAFNENVDDRGSEDD